MLANMLGTTSMLVVVEIVIDRIGCTTLSNEPHVIWNMHLLGEVLDIQADVDNLPLVSIWAVEGNQEAASQLVHHASVEL